MVYEDYDALAQSPESPLWALLDEAQRRFLLTTDAWTGLYEGKVVACGGIIRMWPGLAEAWIAVTPLARQHTVFLYRHVLAFLDLVTETYKLRRIEAKLCASFILARKFAHRLGFTHDALLKRYGPNGEDYMLVSKVM